MGIKKQPGDQLWGKWGWWLQMDSCGEVKLERLSFLTRTWADNLG